MNKRVRNILIASGVTLLFALIYFYLALPALSVHSKELPVYIILCTLVFAAVYTMLGLTRRRRFDPHVPR
ncbi:MAG: hypothetical protein KIG36_05535 [Eubacteriales bacterium]|nr:hypothetical protein [Eubacteriales bacterium]